MLFSSLGNNTGEKNSTGIQILEIFLWAIFILLILLNGMYYIFDIDIITTIKNIFSKNTEIDIKIDPIEEKDKLELNKLELNKLKPKKKKFTILLIINIHIKTQKLYVMHLVVN